MGAIGLRVNTGGSGIDGSLGTVLRATRLVDAVIQEGWRSNVLRRRQHPPSTDAYLHGWGSVECALSGYVPARRITCGISLSVSRETPGHRCHAGNGVTWNGAACSGVRATRVGERQSAVFSSDFRAIISRNATRSTVPVTGSAASVK